MMPELILLGPQRLQPIVRPELDRLGVGDRVAAITAGWQEREGETGEMQAHLEREVVDLELHRRTEEVWEEDPSLFRAHRARQDRLQAHQRLYRMRLDFALEPARRLLRKERGADPELLDVERASAIEAVRRLDQEHLSRLREVHESFEEQWHRAVRDAVKRQIGEIRSLVEGSSALAIAGGHVAVLLNRMRLFGLAELMQEGSGQMPVAAWAAGAMALGERIVLFHDSPPQGAGNAEILDAGLGCYVGLVPLPSATARLRLDDPVRVSLFARRFAPALCVPLDARRLVRRAEGRWLAGGEGGSLLGTEGEVRPWEQAA